MSGSTMETQPSQEDVELLKQEIFEAAGEGRAEDIRSALSNVSPDVVKDVLHHQTSFHRQRCICSWKWQETPLSTAAEQGHLEVVKLLVEEFNVDINQTVEAMGIFFAYVNAQMRAYHMGYFDTVKLLVTKGCAVNLATKRNQSAVYRACEWNCLEVVKYLVESGAKIGDDADNEDGRTCLMAASKQGSEEIVEYLVEKGANVNKATKEKITALHIAAWGNAMKVVKILMENGAMMSSDSEGCSPLMKAAWRRSRDVVSFFAQSSYVNRKEKIDSLELLGARMVTQNRNAALGYLHQAMIMRHEDPLEVIPKPHSMLPAPCNVKVSQTLEELEARVQDPYHLHLECLATAQRILGPRSYRFAQVSLEYAGDLFLLGHLNEALAVLIHALYAREGLESTEGSLFPTVMTTLSYILSAMMTNGQVPRFSSLCEIFKLSLEIVEQKQPASWSHSPNWKSYANVCLLCISAGLEVARGQEEMGMLQKLAKSLIHLQPSPFSGGSVLHATVSTDWDLARCGIPVKDLHVDSVVSFLVQCSADVNAVDNNRNRPLHILAKCPEGYFDAETLRNLIHTLVEAGAPVFVLNREGQTPLDIAVTEEVAGVLQELYPVSLQSLAATAVVKHGIPYTGQVPEILEEFLQRH